MLENPEKLREIIKKTGAKSTDLMIEEDVDTLAKSLGATLEPIMLVGLASIVGFLIIALYLPVFQATTATPT